MILKSLGARDLALLLKDTLGTKQKDFESLNKLIMKKTGGNPFFVNQFLRELYGEGLINWNAGEASWTWRISEIEAHNITDNVVELMVSRLSRFPERTLNVLRNAACIGNSFRLGTLSIIIQDEPEQVIKDLWPALKEELILGYGVGASGLFSREQDGGLEYTQDKGELRDELKEEFNPLYRFAHDRIQQAACELLDDKKRKPLHLKIGRLLLERISEEEMEEALIDIVEQLNLGREYMEDAEEKIGLARLNLRAGIKAKKSGAYPLAARLLNIALELLPADSRENLYELTFALYRHQAEAEYLSGNLETANTLYPIAAKFSNNILHRVEILYLQSGQYVHEGRFDQALDIQLECASLLGLELPTDPDLCKQLLKDQLGKIKKNLGERRIEDMSGAPLMEDPKRIALMQTLQLIFISAYVGGKNPLLGLLPGVIMTNLSLEYGNSEYSPIGYACYAMVACSILDEYAWGHRFGELAIALADRSTNLAIRSKTYFYYAVWVMHWSRPLRESARYFNRAYEFSSESGDPLTASYALVLKCVERITEGAPFPEVLAECRVAFDFLLRTRHQEVNPLLYAGVINPIANLQGKTESLFSLNDENLNEADYLKTFRENHLFLAWFYAARIRNAGILGLENEAENYRELLKTANLAIENLPGESRVHEVVFYAALILARNTGRGEDENSGGKNERADLESLDLYLEKLKVWAEHYPQNFLHKYRLIQGEQARLLGKEWEAMEYYAQAVESARENEYIVGEALANEYNAYFWLARGREEYATHHLKSAVNLYERWGAIAKKNELLKRHSSLFLRLERSQNQGDRNFIPSSGSSSITATAATNTSASQDGFLDMETVQKAARAISGELNLDSLLSRFMEIIMENAGADRAHLVMERKTGLLVEIMRELDEKGERVRREIAPEDAGLAISLVRYTFRSGENIVLQDAASGDISEHEYAGDPYIRKQKPRSVLCMALRHKDRLSGVLYLENNLNSHAFTVKRLRVLDVLLAQAAISLENARVYDRLEELVRERTRELEKTHQKLLGTAHQAGMSEVASNILHNVGNVLNSALTPAGLIMEEISDSKITSLEKLGDLFKKHGERLGQFIQNDPAGQKVPEFVEGVLKFLGAERKNIYANAKRISESLAHIREIIRLQQTYVGGPALRERLTLTDLVDDAIDIHAAGLSGREVPLVKQYDINPEIEISRHKVMMILINLLKNALESIEENQPKSPRIVIRVQKTKGDDTTVSVKISDNGSGIKAENLERIFQHGFTTKKNGHGFGLHSSANAAAELGGRLLAESEGPTLGACFTLVLPLSPKPAV